MQKLAIGALAVALLSISPSVSATHPIPLLGLDPDPVPFAVGTVVGTIEFLGNGEGPPSANAVTLSGNISPVSELLIFRTNVSSGTLASISVEVTAPVTESHGAGTTLEDGVDVTGASDDPASREFLFAGGGVPAGSASDPFFVAYFPTGLVTGSVVNFHVNDGATEGTVSATLVFGSVGVPSASALGLGLLGGLLMAASAFSRRRVSDLPQRRAREVW